MQVVKRWSCAMVSLSLHTPHKRRHKKAPPAGAWLVRAGQICYREEDLASDADVAFEVETRGGSECLFVFAHRHDHETLVLTQTRTGGDEVTTDNVLLEAFERIDLTVDSSIVEDLRRFLEGSS